MMETSKLSPSVDKINSIYTEYFSIIDSYFGSIKHHLKGDEESHIDLGAEIARYPLISDLIIDAIDDIDHTIEKFWEVNAEIVFGYIKKQDSLKCLYSGDITPTSLERFIKRSALYIDTVIIPDPIVNLGVFQKQITIDKKYYLEKIIRHVFNVWKLRALVLNPIAPKAVLVVPINLMQVDPSERKKLITEGDDSFTNYFSGVFKQKLTSVEECLSFLEEDKSSDDVYEKLKVFDLLPQKFKEKSSFLDFLTKFSSTGKFVKFREKETAGADFVLYLRSQFIRVQEHKYFCEQMLAEPIYDYDLPWFFFNYETGGMGMDAAIVNSLQQKKEFDWIGNVPLAALSVLRSENKLDYMRATMRHGLTDLKARTDVDLIGVATQVEKNLKEAFEKQKSELSKLQKKVNGISKKELPIVTGMSLAGFLPKWGVIFSLISAAKDIKQKLDHKKIIEKRIRDNKNSFISLLIKAKEE